MRSEKSIAPGNCLMPVLLRRMAGWVPGVFASSVIKGSAHDAVTYWPMFVICTIVSAQALKSESSANLEVY